MARNYTSIHNSYLTSDTIAEMSDTDEAIFVRLLIVADDWGRFPYDPAKLKRLMSDFKHDESDIENTLKLLLKSEDQCISKYKVGGKEYCQWVEWGTYQQFRFKNEAIYPNESGEYESTTNPGANRKDKLNPRNKAKSNKAKSNKTKQNISDDLSSDVCSNLSREGDKPKPDQTKITDMYCKCYLNTFKTKGLTQKTLNKEFDWKRIGKRCTELLKKYDADAIRNAIQFMFNNHNDLWSQHLSNFTSCVTQTFISKAVGMMRNPVADKKKLYNPGWECGNVDCDGKGYGDFPGKCPKCGEDSYDIPGAY